MADEVEQMTFLRKMVLSGRGDEENLSIGKQPSLSDDILHQDAKVLLLQKNYNPSQDQLNLYLHSFLHEAIVSNHPFDQRNLVMLFRSDNDCSACIHHVIEHVETRIIFV